MCVSPQVVRYNYKLPFTLADSSPPLYMYILPWLPTYRSSHSTFIPSRKFQYTDTHTGPRDQQQAGSCLAFSLSFFSFSSFYFFLVYPRVCCNPPIVCADHFMKSLRFWEQKTHLSSTIILFAPTNRCLLIFLR